MAKNSIAVWNVAHQCNLKCKFCFGPAISESKCLTTTAARRNINKLAAEGYKSLVFTGGEPLLRSDIIDLIKYAKLKGLHTILHTNGVLVGAKFIRQAAKYLDQINLPLDGNNAKSNDAIRAKGHFDKVISLLRQLKNEKIKIIISTVVFRDNIKKIKEVGSILPGWIYKWRVFQVRDVFDDLAVADEEFKKLDLEGLPFMVQKIFCKDKEFEKSYTMIDKFYNRIIGSKIKKNNNSASLSKEGGMEIEYL